MEWIKLTEEFHLEEIKKISEEQPVLIFKHSTNCSVSSTAKSRLERNWKEKEAKNTRTYHLDLIAYRQISNKIATEFNVKHESPQILIIRNGKSIYNASHLGISFDGVKSNI